MKNIINYKVGVTGGIGSGKSTVCRMFEVLGLPVFYADQRAIELIHSDAVLISLYRNLFGKDIYQNGVLDRKRVSEMIFNNQSLITEVQNAVHPAVRKDFNSWATQQKSDVVLMEGAVLFEGGGHLFLDDVILVTAPEEMRVNRVMLRDSVSREQVLSRMRNQWTDDKKISLSKYVITADNNELLIPQILDVYHQLIIRSNEILKTVI